MEHPANRYTKITFSKDQTFLQIIRAEAADDNSQFINLLCAATLYAHDLVDSYTTIEDIDKMHNAQPRPSVALDCQTCKAALHCPVCEFYT